jgi:hypothetical protein
MSLCKSRHIQTMPNPPWPSLCITRYRPSDPIESPRWTG